MGPIPGPKVVALPMAMLPTKKEHRKLVALWVPYAYYCLFSPHVELAINGTLNLL